MKSKLLKLLICSCYIIGTVTLISSCGDDNNYDPYAGDPNRTFFHVVLGLGKDGNDGVYTQARADISADANNISFSNYGYEIPATRTARVIGSEDGRFLYSLDYGGGTITKFSCEGGESYTPNGPKLNIADAIGTHPRWGKVSDETALLHNITTERIYKDEAGKEYDYTKSTASLVAVGLGGDKTDLKLETIQQLEIPRSEKDIEKGLYIWRIDAPVIHNGKVYYGVAKRIWDPATNNYVEDYTYSTTTLVADYPSLTNLTTIESTQAKGENYGYRTPVSYVDSRGDIYQVVGSDEKASILKISNGAYDNSYKFDLSTALGQEVGALGWFYVGEGIGYVLFFDIEQGQSEAASAWGIARVDVYNKTAIKMNIPYKLWLRQYQQGVLRNGKFHMALAPIGTDGAVYLFDPTSTSPDGFTVGAKLDNKADQFYIGMF